MRNRVPDQNRLWIQRTANTRPVTTTQPHRNNLAHSTRRILQVQQTQTTKNVRSRTLLQPQRRCPPSRRPPNTARTTKTTRIQTSSFTIKITSRKLRPRPNTSTKQRKNNSIIPRPINFNTSKSTLQIQKKSTTTKRTTRQNKETHHQTYGDSHILVDTTGTPIFPNYYRVNTETEQSQQTQT